MTDRLEQKKQALANLRERERAGYGKPVAYEFATTAEQLEQDIADAQALADVRTLDEYARQHVNPSGDPSDWVTSWFVAFSAVPIGDAKTPDEARAKAAAWVREQAKGAPCPACGSHVHDFAQFSNGEQCHDVWHTRRRSK